MSSSATRTGSALLLLLGNPTDGDCWNAFVERYAPKIYGWCRQRGLQEADAEDVARRSWLSLCRSCARSLTTHTKARSAAG